jgi:hypothetical protein
MKKAFFFASNIILTLDAISMNLKRENRSTQNYTIASDFGWIVTVLLYI